MPPPANTGRSMSDYHLAEDNLSLRNEGTRPGSDSVELLLALAPLGSSHHKQEGRLPSTKPLINFSVGEPISPPCK